MLEFKAYNQPISVTATMSLEKTVEFCQNIRQRSETHGLRKLLQVV